MKLTEWAWGRAGARRPISGDGCAACYALAAVECQPSKALSTRSQGGGSVFSEKVFVAGGVEQVEIIGVFA